MAYEWEYDVEFGPAVRTYKRPDLPEGEVDMHGIAWTLHRSTKIENPRPDGPKRFREALITSPEVFDSTDKANQDMLVKLCLLRCQVELPLDKMIREIVERI